MKSFQNKLVFAYDKMYSSYYREFWEGKISVIYKLPKYLKIINENIFQNNLSQSILELGAGDGEVASILYSKHKKNIVRYIASELSSIGIKRIKENINNRGFSIVQMDAVNLAFKDQSFDVVISIDVMHHVNNPEIMANEMLRISKKKVFLIESNGLCLIRKLLEKTRKYRSTNENSYFPWEYKNFFLRKNLDVKKFKIKPFLFMVPHMFPIFIPINVMISEIMEKIPILRWQCSGVIISIEKN